MELAIYVLGNMLVNAAAWIPFKDWYDNARASQKMYGGSLRDQRHRGLISRDLQTTLVFGAFLRMYWTCSPPSIWSQECLPVMILAILDTFISPLIWLLLLVFVARSQIKSPMEREMPIFFTYPCLCTAAMLVAAAGSQFLPSLDMVEESWPLSDVGVIANMAADTLAMIPQMYITMKDQEKARKETSHFVGLLCLGRLMRMSFWLYLILKQWAVMPLSADHYVWTFVVPDIVHTVIMADYLYIWLKKVKADTIDPLIDQMMSMV